MTMNSHPGSARIYAFPARGRTSTQGTRETSQRAVERSPLVVESTFGSGWYHEAAVQASEPARKH